MDNIENNVEIAYLAYDGRVKIGLYALIAYAWNKFIEEKGDGNKIFLNNKEFFENSFENPYDAAWAVSLSGKWSWKDDFVCFDKQGYLTSFSRWDDDNSPIDIDKIDVDNLIRSLQDLQEEKSPHKNRYVVDNIPRAIHDALQKE